MLLAFFNGMQHPIAYEIVGYIASVLIAISVMNTNVLRLRIFNVIGATFFAAYGFLIKAWPITGLNLFIVCVNAYHLYRIFTAREYFRILEVNPDSPYLRHFLSHYLKDIRQHNPHFEYQPSENQITLFVLRDTVPAGLFIADPQPGGDLLVRLDYVAPDYRDMKVARFLLTRQAEYFRARGIQRIISKAATGRQAEYLKKMGFIPVAPAEDTDMVFSRSVA